MAFTHEYKKEVMKYLFNMIGLEESIITFISDTLGFIDVTSFVWLETDEFKANDWKTGEAGLSIGQTKSLSKFACTLRYYKLLTFSGTFLPDKIKEWK